MQLERNAEWENSNVYIYSEFSKRIMTVIFAYLQMFFSGKNEIIQVSYKHLATKHLVQ